MATINTRHLVDPELVALLDLVPTIALSTEILPDMRVPTRLPFPEASEAGKAVEIGRASCRERV